MAQILEKGGTIPNFKFQTAYEQDIDLYERLKGKKTFLLFLRYYGCTVCQVDIHNLKTDYEKFAQRGAQVLVVLQSDPKLVEAEAPKGTLPFDIICDPEQTLYKQFEIKPAKSMLGLVSFSLPGKMGAAKKMGFEHGKYEGNEQQLPAVFLLDENGKVMYAHYAKNLTDMPSHDEMLSML